MGYLEKVFLGTLALSGLLILFVFGLYFDIGDMVAGTFAGQRPSYGIDVAQIRASRRHLEPDKEPVQRARKNPGGAAARPSGPVDYSRFVIVGPQPSRDVLVDREVRRLMRKGHVDEEFIRMKAIYEVDTSLIQVFDQYDQFADAGDWEGAIQVLLEAQEGIEEQNLMGQRDMLRYLYQAYLMSGRDAEATAVLEQMTNLHERIVGIEERAEQHQDPQSQEYLRKMRTGFGQLREAMNSLKGNPELMKAQMDVIRSAENGDATIPIDERALQSLKAQLLAEEGATDEQVRQVMAKFRVGESLGGQ